jgi:hypothetical protein
MNPTTSKFWQPFLFFAGFSLGAAAFWLSGFVSILCVAIGMPDGLAETVRNAINLPAILAFKAISSASMLDSTFGMIFGTVTNGCGYGLLALFVNVLYRKISDRKTVSAG